MNGKMGTGVYLCVCVLLFVCACVLQQVHTHKRADEKLEDEEVGKTSLTAVPSL